MKTSVTREKQDYSLCVKDQAAVGAQRKWPTDKVNLQKQGNNLGMCRSLDAENAKVSDDNAIQSRGVQHSRPIPRKHYSGQLPMETS